MKYKLIHTSDHHGDNLSNPLRDHVTENDPSHSSSEQLTAVISVWSWSTVVSSALRLFLSTSSSACNDVTLPDSSVTSDVASACFPSRTDDSSAERRELSSPFDRSCAWRPAHCCSSWFIDVESLSTSISCSRRESARHDERASSTSWRSSCTRRPAGPSTVCWSSVRRAWNILWKDCHAWSSISSTLAVLDREKRPWSGVWVTVGGDITDELREPAWSDTSASPVLDRDRRCDKDGDPESSLASDRDGGRLSRMVGSGDEPSESESISAMAVACNKRE